MSQLFHRYQIPADFLGAVYKELAILGLISFILFMFEQLVGFDPVRRQYDLQVLSLCCSLTGRCIVILATEHQACHRICPHHAVCYGAILFGSLVLQLVFECFVDTPFQVS